MTSDQDRLLDALKPPQPPPELRDRSLRAATDVLRRPPVPDRWTRIWESRPLRLAWAAAVAGLLVANTLIPTTPRPAPATAQGFSLHQLSRAAEDEIRAIATMPRLDLNARSLSGVVSAAAARTGAEETQSPNQKENA